MFGVRLRAAMFSGMLFEAIVGFDAISPAAVVAGTIGIDVRIEPGVPPSELHRWNQLLGSVGFGSVRLGGGANVKAPAIETSPGVGGPSYSVSAVLTRGGELIVPGGRFRSTDQTALSSWVSKLRTSGPPRPPGEKPLPFGLQPTVLDVVRRDLARPVDFSTAGRPPLDVVNDLANRLASPLTADAEVARQLGSAEKVPGELKGLACGTVAAAMLRREGLSLVPTAGPGSGVEYQIVRPVKDQEIWPVGWSPEKPLTEILPELFTLRNVKIDGYKASDLFQIVADRLKLPMLFDEQALVLKKIDPSKVTVSIPEGQLGYGTVLDRAMFQAMLKHEIRVDDGGRPFLWVTAR